MNRVGLTKLLKTLVTPVKVWADFVPEGKDLPALSYVHIANGGSRVLKGNRSGLWDTWRVSISGKNRAECDTLLGKLKTLDNSESGDFTNIFVEAEGDNPAEPDDEIFKAFMDIKTYG